MSPGKALSATHTLTELNRRLQLAASAEHCAFAVKVLDDWPWAALENAPTYLAALALAVAQGSAAELHELAARLQNKNVSKNNAAMSAWRARLVDVLSALTAAPSTPGVAKQKTLPEVSPKQLQAPWLALAKARDPASLEVLLTTLPRGPATDVGVRCMELMGFAADPRISAAMISLVQQPQVKVAAEQPYWLAVLGCLASHPTLEAADAVKKLCALAPEFSPLELLIRRRAGLVAMPKSPAKKKSTGGDSAASWLRRIVEAPGDLSLRPGYADWLSEQGDPRGEFIALQCVALERPLDRAQKAREAQLLKAHRKDWVLPFRRFMAPNSEFFRGGFVTRLAASPTRADQLPSQDDAPWALLEELDLCFQHALLPELRRLLVAPSLRNLRALDGVRGELAKEVFSVERPRLERLGLSLTRDGFGAAQLAEQLDRAEFPQLRTLEVKQSRPDPETLEPLLAAKVFVAKRGNKVFVAKRTSIHPERVDQNRVATVLPERSRGAAAMNDRPSTPLGENGFRNSSQPSEPVEGGTAAQLDELRLHGTRAADAWLHWASAPAAQSLSRLVLRPDDLSFGFTLTFTRGEKAWSLTIDRPLRWGPKKRPEPQWDALFEALAAVPKTVTQRTFASAQDLPVPAARAKSLEALGVA